MIVFDLQCRDGGETFEAWFRSNADFDEQQGAGLVQCPFCGSTRVAKAPMAPSVPRKSAGLAKLAELQAEMLKESKWVGDRFADTARAMHSGEIETGQVHGNATLAEAKALVDRRHSGRAAAASGGPADPSELIEARRIPIRRFEPTP